MRKWLMALWALACLACAPEPHAQVLAVVDLAPELVGQVAVVEATLADESWLPAGKTFRFRLRGSQAEAVPLSFAVLPDDQGHVRLVVRGYEEDLSTRPLLERQVEAVLDPHEKRRIDVRLQCGVEEDCRLGCSWDGDPSCRQRSGTQCVSDSACETGVCFDGYCCQERCTGACVACNRPGTEGRCVSFEPEPSPDNCGGCGMACNLTHVSVPHCSPGAASANTPGAPARCDGTCAPGWDDCGIDQRVSGCAVDLQSTPEHCGGCGIACPFGVCASGACASSSSLGSRVAEQEVVWPPDRMFGTMLFIGEETRVAGLGIKLRLDDGGDPVRVKLGLYRSNSDRSPGFLERSSAELTTDRALWTQRGIVSVHGGIEVPIAPITLPENSYYYLFFIADRPAVLLSEAYDVTWQASAEGELSYAGVGTLPNFPGGTSTTVPYGPMRPLGALYTINVPRISN